jgi:hypothetical protein
MYIDEVGNPSVARLEPFDNRFFSLTAAVIELKHEPRIAQDLAALKLKYFGSDSVIQQVLTSKHLKIRPKSANEAGLQLADLLAYPSYREILASRGLLSTERGLPDMTKQLVSVVASSYYRSNEVVRGRIFLE